MGAVVLSLWRREREGKGGVAATTISLPTIFRIFLPINAMETRWLLRWKFVVFNNNFIGNHLLHLFTHLRNGD